MIKLALLHILFVALTGCAHSVCPVLAPCVVHAELSGKRAASSSGCRSFEVRTCTHSFDPPRETPCICDVDLYKWFLGLALLFTLIATLILMALIEFVKYAYTKVQSEQANEHNDMAEQLTEAKRQGHLRRLRASGPLIIFGLALICAGIPIYIEYIRFAICCLASPATVMGFVLVVAGLLPTDTNAIVVVALTVIIVLLFLSAKHLEKGMYLATADIPYYRDKPSYKSWRIFEEGSRGILDVSLAFYLLGHLYFSPMHTSLQNIWKVAGINQLYSGINNTVCLIISKAVFGVEFGPIQKIVTFYEVFSGYLIAILCLTPRLRYFLRDMLSTHSQEAAAAAGVAQCISHQDPLDVIRRADETFMCVSADMLTQEDMLDNKPNPELFSLAKRAQLGSVDAFVSHSWHDNAELKWESIQSWRQRFKNDNGGTEPKFWIDKYCIDQNKINDSLACLPIYLQGCKQLLVFCGETYLERLWCLVEIFVFQEMNFSRFEIQLLGDKEKLMPSIQNFDIHHASCSTEADTDKLMAVLDAGDEVSRGKLVNFVRENFTSR